MQTWLVTGGAGFIGGNFVLDAVRSGIRVVNLDALTYAGNLDTLSPLEGEPGHHFVQGDIGDRGLVDRLLAEYRPSALVNFAAESHVDRSIVNPDAFISTNCGGTNVMCDIARQLEVDRFLHISTDEVYGSVEEGSSVESDPLEPRSPYSSSKAGSDLIALSYHQTYGLPVLVTRSSNNFGPWHYPEKVIPLFVTNLVDGADVPLYGDGSNERDWLHVDDHCRAIDRVIEHGVEGEVYNIGGGNEVRNVDLTRRLLALTGRGDEMIRPVADRPGHDRRYALDTSKLQGLGWAPQVTFEDGLAETVRWYQQNEWWWRPIKEQDAAFRAYYDAQYGNR